MAKPHGSRRARVKACRWCGGPIGGPPSHAKKKSHCSKPCRDARYRIRERPCLWCGAVFVPKWRNQKDIQYCGQKCGWGPRRLSEEERRRRRQEQNRTYLASRKRDKHLADMARIIKNPAYEGLVRKWEEIHGDS